MSDESLMHVMRNEQRMLAEKQRRKELEEATRRQYYHQRGQLNRLSPSENARLKAQIRRERYEAYNKHGSEQAKRFKTGVAAGLGSTRTFFSGGYAPGTSGPKFKKTKPASSGGYRLPNMLTGRYD